MDKLKFMEPHDKEQASRRQETWDDNLARVMRLWVLFVCLSYHPCHACFLFCFPNQLSKWIEFVKIHIYWICEHLHRFSQKAGQESVSEWEEQTMTSSHLQRLTNQNQGFEWCSRDMGIKAAAILTSSSVFNTERQTKWPTWLLDIHVSWGDWKVNVDHW